MRARTAGALATAILLTSSLPAASPGQEDRLALTPDRPRPGERVEVTYSPAAGLADEPILRLRARLRTPGDPSYNRTLGSRTVAELAPDDEGSFRGSFAVPDSVVYVALAVEDTAATTVDTREGAFWELTVHGPDGRPLFAALEQRFRDHMGRDLREVLETARAAVRNHPDRLRGWDMLQVAETWIFADHRGRPDEGRRDTLRALVARLDSALAGRDDLPVDRVRFMARYAEEYADDAIAARWEERWRTVRERRPGHVAAVRATLREILPELREEPGELLGELDRLWETAEGPEARRALGRRGLRAARRVGEEGPLRRWADRYRASPPGLDHTPSTAALEALLSNEATRSGAISSAKEQIDRLLQAPDTTRRLGETRAEHEARMARRAATLRASLGEALLAEGDTMAGLEAVERAASVGWDTGRYRTLAEGFLEAGDREGATEAFAAVAADPATSPEAADSLRRVVDADPATWKETVERARAEMIERTLASARAGQVSDPEALSPDGTRVRLDERLGEEATVVVHWSRSCPYSRRAMPEIVELAEELAAEDVPLLAATGDAPEKARAYLREEGVSVEGGPLEVLFDVEGEVAAAVGSWGTPQYYVLDGEGRLRFTSSLDDLTRHVAALRTEAAETTVGR